MLAAFEGRTDAIGVLLDRGANIEARNDLGETPFILAADVGRNDVKVLLDLGTDPFARDNQDKTALDHAKAASWLWAAVAIQKAMDGRKYT